MSGHAFKDATKEDYLRDKLLDDVQRYAEEDRDDAQERAEDRREREHGTVWSDDAC